jgi:hypothetical protein
MLTTLGLSSGAHVLFDLSVCVCMRGKERRVRGKERRGRVCVDEKQKVESERKRVGEIGCGSRRPRSAVHHFGEFTQLDKELT